MKHLLEHIMNMLAQNSTLDVSVKNIVLYPDNSMTGNILLERTHYIEEQKYSREILASFTRIDDEFKINTITCSEQACPSYLSCLSADRSADKLILSNVFSNFNENMIWILFNSLNAHPLEEIKDIVIDEIEVNEQYVLACGPACGRQVIEVAIKTRNEDIVYECSYYYDKDTPACAGRYNIEMKNCEFNPYKLLVSLKYITLPPQY